jgi:hypothetical protein
VGTQERARRGRGGGLEFASSEYLGYVEINILMRQDWGYVGKKIGWDRDKNEEFNKIMSPHPLFTIFCRC